MAMPTRRPEKASPVSIEMEALLFCCGAGEVEDEAPPPVAETEARVADDSVALYRARRAWLVRAMRRLALSVADGAVDAAGDGHARALLESREALREEMQAAGLRDGDLPLSFGSSRRAKHEEPPPASSSSSSSSSSSWRRKGGKKRRKQQDFPRKQQQNKKPQADAPNPHPELVADQYWAQRHHYFSAFDEGIQLDAEGWFSVTPERIAAHIAERCRCGLAVDAFAGCGGNAIALAQTCGHVIACDIDARRLAYARHNAAIYDVAHKIDFVLGDALALLPTIRADLVFLSPPWGGPSYLDQPTFDMAKIRVGHLDGAGLLDLALRAAPNVAYYLPRTTPAGAIAKLASGRDFGHVELEANYLNNKIKARTAYFFARGAAGVSARSADVIT